MEYLYKVIGFFRNKKHIEALVLSAITVIIIASVFSRVRGSGPAAASADATGPKPFILDDTGSGDSSADATEAATDDYQKEEEGSQLHDLLSEYYSLYAAGDTDNIEKVASPVSDMEKSYIRFMAKLIDSYDIQEIYTKDGVSQGSKLVSVYVQMHFADLTQAAPGLDFFYIETDSSKAMHINNLYSSFNQTNQENDMDPKVVSAIAAFESSEDLVALRTKVQQEYNQIKDSDKDFEEFMSKTYPSRLKSWQSKYREKLKKAEEAAKAEEEAAAEETSSDSSSSKAYKTTTKTNLRKKASIDSDIIETLKKGTTVTKTGSKGKWYKVTYKGQTGYIRKEYLKKVKAARPATDTAEGGDAAETTDSDSTTVTSDSETTAETTSTVSGPEEGTKIVLKDTVNVRKKPSTDADRINLAYEGQKVLIIKNRSDGWTKIQFQKKKGYVKTKYLV